MTTPAHVRSILDSLPTLAAEVFLTWGHPNPSGESNDTRRPPAGSKPPTDLEAWDTLRVDEKGMLARLSMCVRMICEELRDADQPWPDLCNPPTWAGECRWLLDTAQWWQAQPWHDDIDHDLRQVHTALARASRTPQPARLICPRSGCIWPVHPQSGGSYYECEAGHVIDHHAEIRRMAQVQEVTLRVIADRTGVPSKTLHRWHKQRLLIHVRKDGREHLFDAADTVERVARLRTYDWRHAAG